MITNPIGVSCIKLWAEQINDEAHGSYCGNQRSMKLTQIRKIHLNFLAALISKTLIKWSAKIRDINLRDNDPKLWILSRHS